MKCLILLFLLWFPYLALAQEKAEDKEAYAKRKGAIKGKVTTDDGQPLEGAIVSVSAAGVSGMGNWQQMQTDDEGNFVADGLAPAWYRIAAGSSAYVMPDTPLEAKYNRLGDVVNLTLVKGGVITGRVTNALGEPVIAVPVRVERIADLEGRKTAVQSWFGQPRKTDDRGVYRVYGLPAGRYIVSVGGRWSYRNGAPTPYESDTPTYYASATREAATEVTVNLGDEVRGIDIHYRAEKGHSISGKVTGMPLNTSINTGGIQVALLYFPSRATVMTTYIQASEAAKTFEFFAVPDGEYELSANANGDWENDTQEPYQAPRKSVTVKGGNLSGLELRLLPLASVQAKIEWEVTPEKERKAACPPVSFPLPAETLLQLVKDEPDIRKEVDPEAWFRTAVPNEKREINFRGLEPGTYRFSSTRLEESWYVKSITAKLSTPNPKASTSVDIGKQGINLKPGERRTDVVVMIANGAASLSGRVAAAKNQALPSRMRVHLIPTEPEAAESLLRYAEQKTKDRTFSFLNLAPGRYWLVVRPVPDNESDERPAKPVAWDSETRSKLRQAAEAVNNTIELTPCQRIRDYSLSQTISVQK